jgi:uroporphyrinogen decarboxylase
VASRIENSLFLRSVRHQEIERFPVWMMRQAGRYQASYRALREKHTLLEIVKTPELAAKVTIAAIDEFDFDAGIIFSDILIVLEGMGLSLEFVKGEGPKLSPLREESDFASLRVPDAEEAFAYTLDAIRLTTHELNPRGVPLIGFAGAPFTLACYAIEGGGSRDFMAAKRLAYSRPDLFHKLCSTVVDTSAAFLIAQAKAGAHALQIFDSWAGVLSPSDYTRYALPYVKALVERIKVTGLPIVYFGTGMSSFLPLLKQTGADVIGADWRIDIGDALDQLGDTHTVQGNLDPAYLFAPREALEAETLRILNTAKAHAKDGTGFVFNLGHGILQHTPEENVKRVVGLAKGK